MKLLSGYPGGTRVPPDLLICCLHVRRPVCRGGVSGTAHLQILLSATPPPKTQHNVTWLWPAPRGQFLQPTRPALLTQHGSGPWPVSATNMAPHTHTSWLWAARRAQFLQQHITLLMQPLRAACCRICTHTALIMSELMILVSVVIAFDPGAPFIHVTFLTYMCGIFFRSPQNELVLSELLGYLVEL